MTYQWDFSVILSHKALILSGLINTLKLASVTVIFALVIGLVMGAARSSRSRILRGMASCYVELFRNIPAMILIFWFFYAVPVITGISNDRFLCAAAALTAYGSAYFAEIYRSGIQSIERGQWEAARALGFGYIEQMRFVVMPQALRRMLPAFTNEAIELVKLTSIASAISYTELLYDAKTLSDLEYRPVEAYTTIAFVFIALLFVLTYGSRRLERHLGEKYGR